MGQPTNIVINKKVPYISENIGYIHTHLTTVQVSFFYLKEIDQNGF